MQILHILTEIGFDTRRSHKLATIEKYKSNSLFMRVVKLALDPYINFYIKKIPEYTVKLLENGEEHKPLQWALDELDKLITRQLTGNAAIDHLSYILSSIAPDDSTVVARVISKDLRCGMADGIVNAVVPGYIPTYPCLLARPYDKKNIANIEFPAYSQLKADGVRANAIVKDGKVTLCGRSGRAIDLLGELDHDILVLSAEYGTDMFFDGEFVVTDANGMAVDRRTGNGIISKAIRGTISAEEAAMVRFQVWDAFNLAEFYNGKSTERYETRFNTLINHYQVALQSPATLHSILKFGNFKIKIIPFKIVNSIDEAELHFQEMLAAKQEGTILKNFSGLWEDTRSKDLVKLKAEKDADLEIIGWNPGTGQFENMVGSLICASSDRLVEVSISGFDVASRKWITENIDSLIGKIVTVLYNERIKSKGRESVDSLFLPRFVEFRPDKILANSSAEIK